MSGKRVPKPAPILDDEGKPIEFKPAPDPYDCTEILRALNVCHSPGDVVELRIPGAGKKQTISGYFDNIKRLAKVTRRLANDLDVKKAGGIYFTLNQINPVLLSRAINRSERNAKTTTSDADVTRLKWLPVDLDPIRPKGISSTDEEHEAALDMARKIRSWLIEREWPENAFVVGDSGNGAHILIKIDLEPTGEKVELLKRSLKALDFIFSDEKVEVDTSTSNPARIWKLLGTMARKGDSSKERPHRMARILEAPDHYDDLETVSRDLLEGLAAFLPKDEPVRYNSISSEDWDPEAYALEHNLPISKVKPWNGGTLVELEGCPFNPEHRRTARIGRLGSGARYFGCFHDGCNGNDWHALRDLLEPDRYTKAPTAKKIPTHINGRAITHDGLYEGTDRVAIREDGTIETCDVRRKPAITEEELANISLPEGPKFENRLPSDHLLTRYIG
ncbi:MAG: hypothetical protein JW724_08095 [Candidatus Altiarchaeota archaeon]|nr:hypothetical protein [Candidatus Altiarchaeota archaeon]